MLPIYIKKDGKFEHVGNRGRNVVEITTELLKTNSPQTIFFIEKQNLIKRQLDELEAGL